MREFVYTYLDDFEILHYGNIDAESESEAQKKILEKYGNDIPVEIWCSSQQVNRESLPWFCLDRYFLRKSTANKLVYCGPRVGFLLGRIFFVFLAIMMVLSGELGWSLFAVLMFVLTFIRSLKIVIQRDFVIYKKRFLQELKEEKINISDATRIIPKAIEFKKDNGETRVYCFVCIEKNGQEITIYGNPNSSMRSVIKLSKKMSSFLRLPMKTIPMIGPRHKMNKNRQWPLIILLAFLPLAVAVVSVKIGEWLNFNVGHVTAAIFFLIGEFVAILCLKHLTKSQK